VSPAIDNCVEIALTFDSETDFSTVEDAHTNVATEEAKRWKLFRRT